MVGLPEGGGGRHHGLGVLELVGKGHEDGLEVVRLALVHGRGLEERHVVQVSKLLRHVGAHGNLGGRKERQRKFLRREKLK